MVVFASGDSAVLVGRVKSVTCHSGSALLILNGRNAAGTPVLIPVRFPEVYVKKMKVREGSCVMVLIKNHFAISVLQDGGVMARTPVLQGLKLMYGGFLPLKYGEQRYTAGVLMGKLAEIGDGCCKIENYGVKFTVEVENHDVLRSHLGKRCICNITKHVNGTRYAASMIVFPSNPVIAENRK